MRKYKPFERLCVLIKNNNFKIHVVLVLIPSILDLNSFVIPVVSMKGKRLT